MNELQGLLNDKTIQLADVEFSTRILLNGKVYFTDPSGQVYKETKLAGTQDTGIRFLTGWHDNNVLYHGSDNPYSYIVLGTRLVDITESFASYATLPQKWKSK